MAASVSPCDVEYDIRFDLEPWLQRTWARPPKVSSESFHHQCHSLPSLEVYLQSAKPKLLPVHSRAVWMAHWHHEHKPNATLSPAWTFDRPNPNLWTWDPWPSAQPNWLLWDAWPWTLWRSSEEHQCQQLNPVWLLPQLRTQCWLFLFGEVSFVIQWVRNWNFLEVRTEIWLVHTKTSVGWAIPASTVWEGKLLLWYLAVLDCQSLVLLIQESTVGTHS